MIRRRSPGVDQIEEIITIGQRCQGKGRQQQAQPQPPPLLRLWPGSHVTTRKLKLIFHKQQI
jgi:hypothetical protein